MFENDLSDCTLHVTVHTENGIEHRPVENLAQLVNFRGVPEYVRNPVLREGEEIKRLANGACLIIKHPAPGRAFVTDLRYEYDYQQVKRIVEYSDGHTYESHVPGMPTKEEFQIECEIYGATARIKFT